MQDASTNVQLETASGLPELKVVIVTENLKTILIIYSILKINPDSTKDLPTALLYE